MARARSGRFAARSTRLAISSASGPLPSAVKRSLTSNASPLSPRETSQPAKASAISPGESDRSSAARKLA